MNEKNPTKVRNIFIVGRETDQFLELKLQFNKTDVKFYNYQFVFGTWDDLINFEDNENLFGILAEINKSMSEESIQEYAERINFIRKLNDFKTIPVVLFVEDEFFFKTHPFILNIGIQYFHIIGDDFNIFFSNLYYLLTEDDSHVMKFARAKGFAVEYDITHHLFISAFNYEQIHIETDLVLPNEFDMQINGFNDDNTITVDVLNHITPPFQANYLYSSALGFRFSEGWGSSEASNPLYVDTVETWLSLLVEDGDIKSKYSVHYYCNNSSNAFETFNIVDSDIINFLMINEDDFLKYTKESFVDLFIFQIDQDNLDQDLDDFEKLVIHLSNLGLDIIIICIGHPSESEALRKIYGYDKMLNLPAGVTQQTLVSYFNLLSRSKEKSNPNYVRAISTNSNICKYQTPVLITSLTENEITFKSSVEIPVYSILKLTDPVVMFILIMPEYINLSSNPDGFHYMGLIMGINEVTRQKLRKIVKSYLTNRPVEWKNYNDLEFGAVEVEVHSRDDDDDLVQDQVEKIKKEKASIKYSRDEVRRKSKAMKSKL